MSGKRGVLFVCLGNICRSPIAEAIFLQKIKERGMDKEWYADSAACRDYHTGNRPDSRALAVIRENGITGYEHRARRIKKEDFARFEYIFGMDSENMDMIKQAAPKEYTAKVELFTKYDPQERSHVQDPYYIDAAAFKQVYDHCVEIMDKFLDTVSK